MTNTESELAGAWERVVVAGGFDTDSVDVPYPLEADEDEAGTPVSTASYELADEGDNTPDEVGDDEMMVVGLLEPDFRDAIDRR